MRRDATQESDGEGKEEEEEKLVDNSVRRSTTCIGASVERNEILGTEWRGGLDDIRLQITFYVKFFFHYYYYLFIL